MIRIRGEGIHLSIVRIHLQLCEDGMYSLYSRLRLIRSQGSLTEINGESYQLTTAGKLMAHFFTRKVAKKTVFVCGSVSLMVDRFRLTENITRRTKPE